MLKLASVLTLVVITTSAIAQHREQNARIESIENNKKLKVEKIPADELKAANVSSDTSIRIVDVLFYTGKKNRLEKVFHHSRFQGTDVKRVCYFGGDAKIFAICDSISYPDKSKKVFRYYFTDQRLSVVDDHGKDVLQNISQAELSDWLHSVFLDDQLPVWR